MRTNQKVVIEKVLATTARQILTRGLSEFQIKDVAEEMGITVPALYYYFESRSLLIEESLVFQLQNSLDFLIEALETLSGQVNSNQLGVAVKIRYLLESAILIDLFSEIMQIRNLLPTERVSSGGSDFFKGLRTWCDERPIPLVGESNQDRVITRLIISNLALSQVGPVNLSINEIIDICHSASLSLDRNS